MAAMWTLRRSVMVNLSRWRFPLLIGLVLFLFAMIFMFWGSGSQDARYFTWQYGITDPSEEQGVFKKVQNEIIYLYSAIVNYHVPSSGEVNVIITAFTASRASLKCCVILDKTTLYTTPATIYFAYHTIDWSETLAYFNERLFHPDLQRVLQYECIVPALGLEVTHVTLTSSICSTTPSDYVPVLHPPRIPNGLALCAKSAFGGDLDPEKFIEWVEMQKLMGVDQIFMYDVGNPEPLNRVFRYYQQEGILQVLPYPLTAKPFERKLVGMDSMQMKHDKSLPVLDCRQRSSGYGLAMTHDFDEFIIPKEFNNLKDFYKSELQKHPDAAGLYFHTEFFIYNWGPTHPENDLMITRYQRSTLPHWECTKFLYIPGRIHSMTTHSIFPRSPYKTYVVEIEKALIHHYRVCPKTVWDTCQPEKIIDDSMTRFLADGLYAKVLHVRKATNTITQWTVKGSNKGKPGK